MRLLILLVLLALVPFSYAEALDDFTTLDLDQDIDFTKPGMNEDAIGNRDDMTTPDSNEGATGWSRGYRDDITTPDTDESDTSFSRSLDRSLGR